MNKCYGWQKNYKLVLYLPHTTTKKYPQTNKNKTKKCLVYDVIEKFYK